VIYNIPSTTKVLLSPETIMAIRGLPRVVAIKDSSGDLAHLLRIRRFAATIRSSGCSSALCVTGAALMMGADGMVPGPGNLDPALVVELYGGKPRGRGGGARTPAADLLSPPGFWSSAPTSPV